jgi:hypothetical protein
MVFVNPGGFAANYLCACISHPESVMKNLCTLLVLSVVGLAILGYYRDWFQFSSDNEDNEFTFHVTVDKEKLNADKEKAKQKLEEGGAILQEKAKQITGND